MGVDYRVYLGPYIQVHNPVQPHFVKRQSCPNPLCSDHEKEIRHKFCPDCGTKTEEIKVKTQGQKSFDLYDEFGDDPLSQLSSDELPEDMKDYIILTSNRKGGPGRSFNNETVVFPVGNNTPTAEINHMRSFHFKEITRLEEIFGRDKVSVKWGTIAYYW